MVRDREVNELALTFSNRGKLPGFGQLHAETTVFILFGVCILVDKHYFPASITISIAIPPRYLIILTLSNSLYHRYRVNRHLSSEPPSPRSYSRIHVRTTPLSLATAAIHKSPQLPARASM